MTDVPERLGEMQRISVQHRDARIPHELLAQMRNELFVKFEEDEPRVGVHSLDDLSGVASFPRAEFDNDARPGKIDASSGLPG